MKHSVALLKVAACMIVMLLPAGAATAQEEAVTVEVGPTAQLIDDGQVVRVKVKVTCEPVGEVLEALLFVQQEDAYGEGFLGSVACDSRTHVHMSRVEALDSTFHSGEALVSAFVLVCLGAECADTAQGQETRLVRVVGS